MTPTAGSLAPLPPPAPCAYTVEAHPHPMPRRCESIYLSNPRLGQRTGEQRATNGQRARGERVGDAFVTQAWPAWATGERLPRSSGRRWVGWWRGSESRRCRGDNED